MVVVSSRVEGEFEANFKYLREKMQLKSSELVRLALSKLIFEEMKTVKAAEIIRILKKTSKERKATAKNKDICLFINKRSFLYSMCLKKFMVSHDVNMEIISQIIDETIDIYNHFPEKLKISLKKEKKQFESLKIKSNMLTMLRKESVLKIEGGVSDETRKKRKNARVKGNKNRQP